ncbi:MAG: phage/plasmid primase, P4 family [Clostridiaceae bacterium]|nr:phage/plasmid primase, P4 family [Clostridiaceae bacterium]
MYEKVPNELKQIPQWVNFMFVPNDAKGKFDKVPINPQTMHGASSINQKSWASFEVAVQSLGKTAKCYITRNKLKTEYSGMADGIGIMFGNNVFGIDIDHCFIDGVMTDDANDIIVTMDSYTELSPSGTGVHILAFGSKPDGKCKNDEKGIEMYDTGRFFTVTGNAIIENPPRECTDEARKIYDKYLVKPKPEPKSKVKSSQKPVILSQNEILDAMFRSKAGQKIRSLFDGDWGDYQSQSQADQALANYLAFFTGKDPIIMDSLFRQSRLMRDKWDEMRGELTYGKITIQEALNGCNDIYKPQNLASRERQEAAIRTATALPVTYKPDGSKEYSTDDTGNAQRLKDMYGNLYRYSFREKMVRIWTGKRWREDDYGEIKRFADDVIDKMTSEPMPEGTDFWGAMDYAKHIKRTKSSAGKEAMIKESLHLNGIAIVPDDLDRDPLLLNVLNGTLNLTTELLQPHRQSDMITKIASVLYDPKAQCPTWQRFLGTIFDHDQELISFVQCAVGYSLTGVTREQCFFILYGNGQNGKSTFIETITSMMGNYSLSASPDTFMTKDHTGGANPEVVRLKGARFISTVEPQDGAKFNESLIKQMTGNDTITARPLYAKEIQFRPVFKLWMATNHKPIIRGTDDGIWRRIKLIPFAVRIPDDKKDPDLGDKLIQESSGILNWAIKGYFDYVKFGLVTPQAVLEATLEYRSEMDIIAAFVEDCIQQSSDGAIRSDAMYRCFRGWSSENGFKGIMNQIKFGRELNKRIQSDRSRTGKVYHGYEFTEAGHELIIHSG